MANIYLTGAPATGKTTAAESLGEAADLRVFSYGAQLSLGLKDRVSNQAQLRKQSSRVISRADVEAVDAELLALAADGRGLVVDSHAVTKEDYGFRCIPYGPSALVGMMYTHLVCLYAPAQVVAARIEANPAGRPLPSVGELEVHNELQRALTLAYAHALGLPAFFIDSAVSPPEVVARIRAACQV